MRKKTRFLLLRATIIVVFTILAGRIWYVQVVMGNYYRAQADTSKIRLEPVQALRGIVYDRNGLPLVANAPSWNVEIIPHGIPPSQATRIYNRLSQLLNHDPSPAKIAWMVWSNRWRPYAPASIKQRVSDDTAMIIKQLHSQLPGVRAEPSSVRQYALDSQLSLSHILGYTGVITPQQYTLARQMYHGEQYGQIDQAGRDGIELSMDAYLHGINSTDEVEVDAGERPVRVLHHGTTVPGDSVYLTIDSNLQQQVANDLQTALQKLNVRQGVAVVEDVRNGQILALVSLPSYNNNWFSGQISTKHWNTIARDPSHPLNDLATAGEYSPGSTYKVITAAAALQTGAVTADTVVDDTGSIKLGEKTFYGWMAGGLGPMNIVSALALSSDIYFYTVAGGNPNLAVNPPHAGATAVARYAQMLGLGQPTGIELPGEAAGLVPSPAWYNGLKIGDLRRPSADYSWHIGDTYNTAIGQGFNLATPLQMANVAAAIANGGTLYRPHVVAKIVGRVVPRRGTLRKPEFVQPFVPSVIRQGFISQANLSLIQQGMHRGVNACNFSGGTSYYVCDRRIDAAGKTGTTEIVGHPPHAWWIGYAPFNHPRIAVAVLVPYANSEGAYAAAPIAHKIFEDYFHVAPKPNPLDNVQQQLVGNGGAQ